MSMNNHSQWRYEIAEQIAAQYSKNPGVDAIIVGGSTARGHADRFSDLELGVFWNTPPTDGDRQQVIDAVHADLIRLYAYDPDEQYWADAFTVGRNAENVAQSGLFTEIAHYLSGFMDETLHRVTKEFSTNMLDHNLISGVKQCIALYGEDRVNQWKADAIYPRELSLAVVRRYGVIDHFWRWEMYLHRSDNLTELYRAFSEIEHRLLHTLLGLNGVYYFGFKWLDVVTAQLTIAPDDLHNRLRSVYQVPPKIGAETLKSLSDETFTLIEQHLPEIDVNRLRSIFHYQRPLWDESPPLN